MRPRRSFLLGEWAGRWQRAARLAARDLRGGWSGFRVFVACLALGVACVAAVGVTDRSVRETVRRDGAMLLGGDLVLSAANLPVDDAVLRTVHPAAARHVRSIETYTFATNRRGRSVVIALRAVSSGWPLYGEAMLDPPQPIADALKDRGAVVERTLLSRLDLDVGDRVRIGSTEVEIRAILLREPDRVGGQLAIGPRVLVDLNTLDRAAVLLPGALARYREHFALAPGSDPEALAAALRSRYPEARFQVQTVLELEPRIWRFTDRLTSYLALAALTVLLIGALGIALAVHTYLTTKTTIIATLKCLGATSGDIVRVYALQVGLFAILGTTLGLGVGIAVPAALLTVFADVLPWPIRFHLTASPLLLAAGLGYVTAMLVSVPPLLRTRIIPAAQLFRLLVEPAQAHARLMVAFLGVLAVVAGALAVLVVPRREVGFVFVMLLPPLFAALMAVALIIQNLSRKLAPHLHSLRWRLALQALARPGSPTMGVVMVLGTGLAVLITIVLVETRLREEVTRELVERSAAMFLIDIWPGDWPALRALVQQIPGAAVLQEAPVVRARVVRIGDRPVEAAEVAEDVRWTVQQERALTWRREPPASGLVAGTWWPPDYAGPPLLSIEERVARGYGVSVGDVIAFNVLGRTIEARIANIRPQVDWRQGRIDFVFILSPGVLEAAPVSWIAALDVPEEAEAAFINALASALPHVTPIPMREVVAQVSEVLSRIGFALRLVALLAVVAGVLVLAGALGASRRRQRYETVLYKILGATRRDITGLFLAEYAVLGLAAALVALLFGTVGAWLVLRLVVDLDLRFALLAVLPVLALALGLVLIAGASSIWKIVRLPAARILTTALLP